MADTTSTDSSAQTTESQSTAKATPKYNKRQLLKSVKYMHNRDLLNVLLEDDKLYTAAEVDTALKGFLNKKI